MDDWARELRLIVWDGLLRGNPPNASDSEQVQKLWAARETLGESSRQALRLCLACLALAQDASPALREELRIFLAYYLSRDGSAPIKSLPEPQSSQELTLERLRGREMSWEQIFQIFGRTANPDRVRKLLHEQLERVGA